MKKISVADHIKTAEYDREEDIRSLTAKVTELRNSLEDAIELFCYSCADMDEDTGECKDKDGVCPCVKRWRKALKNTET